ncbi:hypothetical protein KFE98_15300 [bacterium SCSIO 12741]|nr:hypothetical protein KFE98_15300 [bacterium SCSIO 12741]
MNLLKKIIVPTLLTLTGIGFLSFAFATGQNQFFILSAVGLILIGAISYMSALNMLNKGSRMIVIILLAVMVFGGSFMVYKSIKDPVDFKNERDRRYAYVIQNLKDLREAQLKYKIVNGKFANDMDSLVFFIKNESFPQIKSIGNVPDTLTRQQAIEQGILVLDTTEVPAHEAIFNSKYMDGRKIPLVIDSLPYVPFTSTVFEMESGFIERGKVKVPVFQITDASPFDKYKVLMVGSMTDPTTSGNWGE